jgi:hypothetical protein
MSRPSIRKGNRLILRPLNESKKNYRNDTHEILWDSEYLVVSIWKLVGELLLRGQDSGISCYNIQPSSFHQFGLLE